MQFIVGCTKEVDGEVVVVKYVYDNQTSEILDQDLMPVKITPIVPRDYSNTLEFPAVSAQTPGVKTQIKTLKIQMGLSCNYGCEYCSQRFVPRADEGNPKLVQQFMDNLDSWLTTSPEKIEFWGGEPFVYWKTFKPLAEALAEKFLYAELRVVTNGSLLTDEIVDWLDELGFRVGISHDGPGQNVRGPDPLEDPQQRAVIVRLFEKLGPQQRVSFNAMIHRENMDRTKILQYFKNILGDIPFTIGEGGAVDVYDEGGLANSFQSRAEHLAFRRLAMAQLRAGHLVPFGILSKRFIEWVDSFANLRPSYVLGQKCGMDSEDTIAVDLLGNVLTCQNVSAASRTLDGKSHKIGHVKNLDQVRLNTATHWKFRLECQACPLLQGCKGSCMFLQGDYFKVSCDNAYSDHLPFFAGAFEAVTGALPHWIEPLEGTLHPDRQDLWGKVEDPEYIPEPRSTPINLVQPDVRKPS